MKRFIFPYQAIPSGSKIVLYGTGDVGKQYISQLSSQNAQMSAEGYHVEILFAIGKDCNLPDRQLHMVEVYEPPKIADTDPALYDYVVIAVESKKLAQELRQTLLEFGVPAEKIIHQIYKYDDIRNLRDPEVKAWFRPTFSWFGEDLIVSGIFRQLGISKPSYLDVGCNLPYAGSNTALLYLSGSHGVNIDANENCIRVMDQERPDDQNICCGITTEEGERDFYMISKWEGLNSFSFQYIDSYVNVYHKRSPGRITSRKVPCFTLETIIERYCNGVFPDYFDLDIEGLDEEVISSYDFSKGGPKVICTETHSEAVYSQLFAQGYFKFFDTPHNTIFVRKEYFDCLIKT